MANDVEILVHIAALSTSKDDALYRTYASAYCNFACARRIDVPPLEARYIEPALPAELLSPQASFNDVWDGNRRPFPAVEGVSNTNNSQAEVDSQDSWIQPPSVVPDSQQYNDQSIPEFTSPGRVLSIFLQTGGPPSESSQEAGQHSASVYEGDDNLPTLYPRGTEEDIQDSNCGSKPRVEERTSSQRTIYEGDANLDGLLARGTASILRGSRTSPASVAADPSTSDAQCGTPTNIATTGSRMDESHVSQTPSSPLRSKGAQLYSPRRSLPRPLGQPPAVSFDPLRTSQQSQSEVFGVTIPATQLPERADTEPSSAKPFKPNARQQRVNGLSRRATSDVLPSASRGIQYVDWAKHTHLNSLEPPPANHRLGPRVPVKLEELMLELDRYQPIFLAGRSKMREYERGYWLLPLDDWPHGDKLSAWQFLGNYIYRDKHAGWGTRACRDVEWRWLRLYGWEHIAGELYMLLYMAGFQRMKAMDVTWYDGAGDVLIVVEARREKSVCWDNVRRIDKGVVGIVECVYCHFGHDTPGLA